MDQVNREVSFNKIINIFIFLGWSLDNIKYLDLNINKFNPVKASSYIPLPKTLKWKRAIVNVENNDQCCFAWSIISALYPSDVNSNRMGSYPHFSNILNFTNIEFPMKLKDIKKFEILNNISVNVYGLEKIKQHPFFEIVGPLHYTNSKRRIHVNLLLISDETNENYHYCWIKDMSRLISSQINKEGHKKFFCDGCLMYFTSENKLNSHQQRDCNHIKTKIPTTDLKENKFGKSVPENILQFQNFEKQIKVPFVVYADFECYLKEIDHEIPNNMSSSFTVNTCKHVPYAFSYFIKCSYDNSLSKLEHYVGLNAASEFCKRLEQDVQNIYHNHLKHVKPMKPLTKEEQKNFENSQICHICNKMFEETEIKVKDHDHLTGLYNGPAHSICNLNFKIPKFIPIFFHNLTGYDSHLFIKELCCEKDKIDVIAQTKEKYISFSKSIFVDTIKIKEKIKQVYIKLRFLDSFRFVSDSLEKLAESLEPTQCIEIKKYFSDKNKFDIIRQKGVFPYSYVDCMEKLDQNHLPSKDDFFDKLRNQNINTEDYNRAIKAWETFECETLKDYALVYLISDCLILTDFFEAFRTVALRLFKLDPAQYYTAPGLSWDAMLKVTDVKLELLTDIDMLYFFKNNIRGGICHCSVRKAVANNKFLENYNIGKPTNFIVYLDATNLYGHSMSQPLPQGEFKWLTQEEIENINFLDIDDDDEYGYVLEVDIDYPEELHNKHNEFPFLAENICPPNSKNKKLICNLNNKKRYVLHYRNLKQAIANGLELKHIHRGIKFKQSRWLKQYIDLNTEMRNKAKSKLEKNSYKLFNNAVYGKSLENIDKRNDIQLVTHWKNIGKKLGAEGLIAKPNFKGSSIFKPNFAAIQLDKLNVFYNKPVYVGFSVLELSKTVMYDFYYNFIKKEFGEKAILLYTDTDSLIIQIETENFYEDMKKNIQKFDTSNYSKDNIHGIPINPSILGKMKDEYAGQVLKLFYGTGAKAYCVNLGNKVDKKAKGIKKYVINDTISEQDYKDVVENSVTTYRTMNIFQSILHDIYTQLKNKVALSPQDDKRFVIPGTFKTLAWGHKNIAKIQNLVNIGNDKEIEGIMELLNNEFNTYNVSDDSLNEIYEKLLFD